MVLDIASLLLSAATVDRLDSKVQLQLHQCYILIACYCECRMEGFTVSSLRVCAPLWTRYKGKQNVDDRVQGMFTATPISKALNENSYWCYLVDTDQS